MTDDPFNADFALLDYLRAHQSMPFEEWLASATTHGGRNLTQAEKDATRAAHRKHGGQPPPTDQAPPVW
jgi:hypothetical protein